MLAFEQKGIVRVNPKWDRRAACRGLDATIFYPPSEEHAGAAKDICESCPVRTDCLEHALMLREKDGVWGGATEAERRRIIRRRRRAAAKVRALESV